MVRLAGKVRGNGLVEMRVVMLTVKRGRDGRKMMISCFEGKDEKEISHRERGGRKLLQNWLCNINFITKKILLINNKFYFRKKYEPLIPFQIIHSSRTK